MFNHLTAKLNSTQKGMALALGGYTAFSFSDASVKWLSEKGYSIYQIIAVDTAMAAALMLLCAPLLGGLASLKDAKNAKIHGLRTVLNTAINVLIVYCFSIMPLTSVYTAIFTLPFITALIAMPVYGERIGLDRWAIIAVGFAGVLIAFQPWKEGFDLLSMALPIGTTVLISLMFLVARSLKGSSALAMGFYPVIGCCLFVSALTMHDFSAIAVAHLPFFFISGVCMSLGIIGVSLAFRMADSAAVSPMLYFELIWAIIFGALVFGDYPDRWMLIGAAVIIMSGFYVIKHENKR